jgi:ABC-2 type transport system ATP-binding protein
LGPNGSGKTTSIRMICGLLTPDSGEGTCLGYGLRHEAEEIKRRVGYMTQRFSFWEDLSIAENLSFVADMFGLDRTKERVAKALDNLDLTSRARQLAGSLSGGWKQRLALAACILHEPELLLLDEPTAGVDPKARREFWDEIHRLATTGLTVLVSTHYMDEAERCHAIVYIAYGHLIAQGTVQEVIDQAGVTVWNVESPENDRILREMKSNPAVSTAAPFGEALHISGTDSVHLENAIAPYRTMPNAKWTRTKPTLEDAFIHFMAKLEKEEIS